MAKYTLTLLICALFAAAALAQRQLRPRPRPRPPGRVDQGYERPPPGRVDQGYERPPPGRVDPGIEHPPPGQVDQGYGRPPPGLVDQGYGRPPPHRYGGGVDQGYGRPPPAWVQPARRPPPPAGLGQFAGPLMKHLRGAMMDFIGAEMYGDRVFKKLTVILTKTEQEKYSACAKAALNEIKDNDEIFNPLEKKMILDRILGKCMIKAKYNYDDEKIDKLECCTIRAYFHSLMIGGRHKGMPTPPGFRMAEAEFGCFMNLTYGFTIKELQDMKQCILEKVGLSPKKAEEEMEDQLKQVLDMDIGDDDSKEHVKPKLPTQADVEACIMKAKPSMNEKAAKDVAFINTKRRELMAATSAETDKIQTAKRLVALLEKIKN